jgi:[ribosomal protein S5]-alanine N-acetyltransferase
MKKKIQWPIVAVTRRLVLRPYTLNDYEVWKEGFTRRLPKQHKYDSGPIEGKKVSRAAYRRLYLRHERYARKDICYVFGIYDRRNGAQIGFTDVSTISREWHQWANLGYMIHNHHQGKGYGKEACKAVLKIAFTKLSYKRVEAAINPDNRRSIQLAKALGMQREAYRKAFIFEKGRWEDHVVYVGINPHKSKNKFPMLS